MLSKNYVCLSIKEGGIINDINHLLLIGYIKLIAKEKKLISMNNTAKKYLEKIGLIIITPKSEGN